MIRKAVIPAAGFGTRFLPVTKSVPKEMLPLIDKPVIHYVVQEAVDSGIKYILIITSRNKPEIEKYFEPDTELELFLATNNKSGLLDEIQNITSHAKIRFVYQEEMLGFADAVSYARFFTTDEPFAVLLADVIVDSDVPVTQQLMTNYENYRQTILGAEIVPDEKVSLYGLIDGEKIAENIWDVSRIIEKPQNRISAQNLVTTGRYIFTPAIYEAIEQTPKDKEGEILITDSLRILMEHEKVYACKFSGKRHDLGNKTSYLKTVFEYALKHPEYGEDMRRYLKSVVSRLGY
jgi:UTP--glucose-1-phosphate uridylyltransferase